MSFDPVVVLANSPELPLEFPSDPQLTAGNLSSTNAGENHSAPAKKFRNKTWRDAAGAREVSAPLSSLPPEIQFTDDFPEPIRYDATRRLLLYRGFMTNSSYVELQKLSRSLDYARALEQVFTASAVDPAEQQKPTVWIVTGVIACVLLGIAAFIWRMIG